MPYSTASALANLVRRCRAEKKKPNEIRAVISLVHPIVMENITVTADGTLKLTHMKYVWIRSTGWQPK